MPGAALSLLCLAVASATPGAPVRLGPRPKAQPARVVTLAPSLTDAVLALGKGKLLVGVSRFDTREEVKGLPRVGGYVDPSVEAVVALSPDLVLVQPSPGNQRPVEKLAALKIPVLALPMTSIAEAEQGLLEVGRALGAEGEGQKAVERIEAVRAEVKARAKQRKAVRTLFVYDFQPLVVAGPASFAGELLADVGAKNVADRGTVPYPVWSAEAALSARPELVIDASHAGLGAEGLRKLPGLKEARWVRLSSEALMHPGPKLAEALLELEALVYP